MVQQHRSSTVWDGAVNVWCLLQHLPLAELVMGKRHIVGHVSREALAPFWP